MKILVTGGTGLLGKRLVQNLVDEGHDVSVFCRSMREDVPENVRMFTGDIRDKVALRKAFFGAEIVYHLAICLNEEDQSMYDTNVKGTRNVTELCKENRVQQIIYMSSAGVLGETRAPARENFPYNPKTLYEKSKMESEKIIKSSGTTYTIIRTTIVLGPSAVWAQIFEAARRGYPILGNGKNYFHLVYVEDVVRMLDTVKNNSRAINQIFHVASKDVKTYEEVYKIICQEMGCGMTEKHVPLYMAYLSSYLYTAARKIQGKQPSLVKMKSSIDRLVRNRIMSIEKAKEVLDFEPKYDTRAAVRETLKYLKIGRLGYSDYELAEMKKIKDSLHTGHDLISDTANILYRDKKASVNQNKNKAN